MRAHGITTLDDMKRQLSDGMHHRHFLEPDFIWPGADGHIAFCMQIEPFTNPWHQQRFISSKNEYRNAFDANVKEKMLGASPDAFDFDIYQANTRCYHNVYLGSYVWGTANGVVSFCDINNSADYLLGDDFGVALAQWEGVFDHED